MGGPIVIEQFSSARGRHSFMMAMVYPFEQYPSWAANLDDGVDILVVSQDMYKSLIELDGKRARWGKCGCRSCGVELKSVQQVAEHLGEGHKVYFDYPDISKVLKPRKVVVDI